MSPYIKFLKNNLVISLGFILSASNIQAHEFWIEPSDYFLQNENLEAHLKVGQEFEGMRLMYDPNRFEVNSRVIPNSPLYIYAFIF